MKTTNQQQAEQTAERNAAKMTEQGYTLRPAGGTEFLPAAARSVFYVLKPDGTRYAVNTHRGTCNCAYRADNHTCKHIAWATEQAAWAASVEAREAQFTRPVDAIA